MSPSHSSESLSLLSWILLAPPPQRCLSVSLRVLFLESQSAESVSAGEVGVEEQTGGWSLWEESLLEEAAVGVTEPSLSSVVAT